MHDILLTKSRDCSTFVPIVLEGETRVSVSVEAPVPLIAARGPSVGALREPGAQNSRMRSPFMGRKGTKNNFSRFVVRNPLISPDSAPEMEGFGRTFSAFFGPKTRCGRALNACLKEKETPIPRPAASRESQRRLTSPAGRQDWDQV